jgi:hypothetical protein
VKRFVLAFTLLGCDAEPPCSDRVGHVCPIAGTGELGFNRDGVPATEADLFLVSAARRGPDELVYLMDFNNQRLRKIDTEGHLRTVIGNGFHALADVGLPAACGWRHPASPCRPRTSVRRPASRPVRR